MVNSDTAPYLVLHVIVISNNNEIDVLLFLEQVVLKNSKPMRTGDCKDMCWRIAYGVRVHFDSESWKCRCDFCPTHLIRLLTSPKKMAYFVKYTGCEDIFALKKSDPVNGIVYC